LDFELRNQAGIAVAGEEDRHDWRILKEALIWSKSGPMSATTFVSTHLGRACGPYIP
jgi:hypothetical protein